MQNIQNLYREELRRTIFEEFAIDFAEAAPGTCMKLTGLPQEDLIALREMIVHDYPLLRVVVLTDGVWSYQDKAISEAKRCHKYGIEVIALGFGTADEEFLRKIASADDFATLTNLNELSTSFTKIAQEIGGSGKLKI